jgi:hypothetical protein
MTRIVEYNTYCAKFVWDKYIEYIANKEYNNIIEDDKNYTEEELNNKTVFIDKNDSYLRDLKRQKEYYAVWKEDSKHKEDFINELIQKAEKETPEEKEVYDYDEMKY